MKFWIWFIRLPSICHWWHSLSIHCSKTPDGKGTRTVPCTMPTDSGFLPNTYDHLFCTPRDLHHLSEMKPQYTIKLYWSQKFYYGIQWKNNMLHTLQVAVYSLRVQISVSSFKNIWCQQSSLSTTFVLLNWSTPPESPSEIDLGKCKIRV